MRRLQLGSERPLAVRRTVVAVAVALLASAAGSAALTVALHDSLASGLVTFAIFGGLAALTAGVLAWEVASSRACPRCQRENRPAARTCSGCGYDVRARPRYACSEGHGIAYDPGLCHCGRRLLPLTRVPVAGHVLRATLVAVALVLLTFLAAILLSGR